MAYELNTTTLPVDKTPSRSQLVRTVLSLSAPAILSELSTTLMQYIDAGMVGSLGAHATASIGLVESTIWLLDGWTMCAAMGFTVQVAQLIGAGKDAEALLRVPGLGLGLVGAAIGTLLAQLVVAILLLWCACVRSPRLRLADRGPWRPKWRTVRSSLSVSGPMLLERTVMSAAYIAGTVIVAPLGTVAVAANSLAVTAEAVCYMPGIGVSAAATTLVGQAIGANRKDLARTFARLSTAMGMVLMGLSGALMWLVAPSIMAMLTPNAAVQTLGTRVLRIEALAEPLFGASIVAAGALRGAADTLVPSIIAIASMWGVRMSLSALVAPLWGLVGVWSVMAGELCVRGLLFLWRLLHGRWLDRASLV